MKSCGSFCPYCILWTLLLPILVIFDIVVVCCNDVDELEWYIDELRSIWDPNRSVVVPSSPYWPILTLICFPIAFCLICASFNSVMNESWSAMCWVEMEMTPYHCCKTITWSSTPILFTSPLTTRCDGAVSWDWVIKERRVVKKVNLT